MAKNKTTAVATKEVDEDTIALSLQQRYDDANRTIAQKAIIFGATLVAAERELERRGLLKHGGSVAKGGGIQGWLAEHCPEINYHTAMRWRRIAEAQVAALQSKGVGSEDDAIKMLQMDDDGLSVPPTKKALKCRDEIMATPSLRKITQDMFDFAKDKPGRKPGSKANSSEVDTHIAKTAAEKAAAAEQEMREIVGTLGAFLTRGGKINMLTAQAKSDFHTSLVDYAKLLEEQM